jgi:hypothetical protein
MTALGRAYCLLADKGKDDRDDREGVELLPTGPLNGSLTWVVMWMDGMDIRFGASGYREQDELTVQFGNGSSVA